MDLEDEVVGVNPRTFNSANPKILKCINPDYEEIDTKFVNTDFKVNKESLLNLNPTIVLLYGKFRDEGLSNLQIPVENLKIATMDPEEITIYWEEALSDIFKIDNQNKLKNAWDKTNSILSENSKDREVKGMYIFSNMKGIMVSGKNSYGDRFMKLVGIENVAGELEGFNEGAGQAEVSMEQIHEWNPDIIFVGTGAGAKDMIEGNIPNQNWENLDAVKNGKVYDIPNGVYNWGMPCSDSPLLPIWMLNKVDEEAITKEEVDQYIKDFYKTAYDLDLDDELLDNIYNHR
ncbi:MAG: ABC transporter substrate-binding protein [Tissierellia bacterium]|nr:ABC transporter substrate-binding protein [Tissierellia bacterium]